MNFLGMYVKAFETSGVWQGMHGWLNRRPLFACDLLGVRLTRPKRKDASGNVLTKKT
jgi:hypothetical protein